MIANWHERLTNVLFFDGHVETRHRSALKVNDSVWHPYNP